MNKKIIIISSIVLIILTIVGYFLLSKKSNNNTLLVELEQLNLVEGANYSLKALTYPESLVLSYKSNDESIVTIDEYGNIDALKEGTTVLVVSSSKSNKYINVNVTKEEVKVTGLDLKEIEGIKVGEKYLLSLLLYPNSATITDVNWIVSDESILKINDGYIEGIQKGNVQVTAEITVDDKVLSDSITVKVGEEESVKIKSLSFDEEVINVGLNETYQLNPIIEPINASDKNLIYEIDDPSIIEINNGVIKALAKGETIVTVKTSNGKQVNLVVKVKSSDGIVLNIEEISIAKGETYQLKSNFISGIEWYSNNNKVATVDNGLIKGINDGEATITVINSYGRMNTVKVKVEGNGVVVDSLNANSEEITIQTGKNYKLNIEIIPSNATNKEVIYETSDSRIATVDDNGLINAKREGTCYVTIYSSNNKSTSVKVNVTQGKVTLDSLDINPNAVVLSKGDSYQLYTTFTPSNVSDTTVDWKSNDTSIVSIENGLIKALKTGTTTISATSNGVTSTAEVTVQTSIIAITSVDIKDSNFTLSAGQTKKLEVSYLPSNASNKSFSWTSSDSSIASVSSKGVVTANKAGKATITCTSVNGKKDSVVVEVTKQSGSDITAVIMSTENVNLQKGETKQIRATILPLNAKQDVTWFSSNENVVKVENGFLTAVNIGNATISALASNGMVARAKVVVAYPPIYDSGAKTIELLSNTLQVTMTESGSTKMIRVWVADPYNQFHKRDTDNEFGSLVGDLLNAEISSRGLTNSIMIGANASFTNSSRVGIPVGNFIVTEGTIVKETPSAEIKGLEVSYFGVTADGILRAYEPGSKRVADQTKMFAQMKNDGVKNSAALTYETFIVRNGKSRLGTTGNARRPGFCQVNTNNFMFFIVWGTTQRLADVMIQHGCVTGVQLDGGSSTNLFYKNRGSAIMTAILSNTRKRPEAIYFSEY